MCLLLLIRGRPPLSYVTPSKLDQVLLVANPGVTRVSRGLDGVQTSPISTVFIQNYLCLVRRTTPAIDEQENDLSNKIKKMF